MTLPTVEALERAGYATWSSDVTEEIDGWTVRSNGGFTRRVNSATVVGVASTSLGTRERLNRWFTDRSASLAVRVTPLIDEATLGEVKSTWGLVERDTTKVLVTPTAARSIDGRFQLVRPDDAGFTDELETLNDRADNSSAAWRRLIGRLEDGIGIWAPGAVVALAARHGEIVVVYSVAVAPSRRRQGLATAAMGVASAWAASQGARWCALQVEGMNSAALSLYRSLGYREAYTYSYLQPLGPTDSRGAAR